MTNEKTNRSKPAKNEFLNIVYSNLDGLVEELLKDAEPDFRETVKKALYKEVCIAVKESFKNGIEVGERKAIQKKQSSGEQDAK